MDGTYTQTLMSSIVCVLFAVYGSDGYMTLCVILFLLGWQYKINDLIYTVIDGQREISLLHQRDE